jgi:hypothetical protein
MQTTLILVCWTLLTVLTPSPILAADLEERDPAYYHTGELAGSLRSNNPLPLFDADPQHLWNRLFAAVTIRPSRLPSVRGGPPVARIEGGDRIEFFGWGGTTYWDESANVAQLERHLDQFLGQGGEKTGTISKAADSSVYGPDSLPVKADQGQSTLRLVFKRFRDDYCLLVHH